MSLTDIILKMPTPYLIILIAFSLYYAIRGVLEQTVTADYDRLDSRLKESFIIIFKKLFLKLLSQHLVLLLC